MSNSSNSKGWHLAPKAARWVLGVVAAAIISLVVTKPFAEDPPPSGSIDSPKRGDVMPPTESVAGELRHVPGDRHAWLATQQAEALLPLAHDLDQPDWEVPVPARTPRGKRLSLLLFTVDDDGDRLLRDLPRGRSTRLTELPDIDKLDSVPSFFVKQEGTGRPLYSVFPQSRPARGEPFRYVNGAGKLHASFSDALNCHRPSRAFGLRLTWNMSAIGDNGGWGVIWPKAPGKRFDASPYRTLVMTAKGREGGEAFSIGLKDTAERERKVESDTRVTLSASEWRSVSVPIARFRGVKTRKLENLNFGFDERHGAGSVCIDEITLH